MKLHALIAAAMLVAAALPQDSFARQQGQNQTANTMPPALRAAVNAGNSAAVEQAINALSGGNAERKAALAQMAMKAAEAMASTNPGAAAQIALVAAKIFKDPQVYAANPAAGQDALATAARIMVNPNVQNAAPDASRQLAFDLRSLVSSNPVFQASPAAAQVTAAVNTFNLPPANQFSSPGSPGSGSTNSAGSGSGSGSGGGGSAR